MDADFLNELVFAHAANDFGFQIAVLVAQNVAGLLEFELRPDAGEDDAGTDRFGDVVHGATVEAAFFVFRPIHGRDKNDRDVPCGRCGPQLGENLVAIHFGHHHIEQDEVRGRCAERNLQGTTARVGGAYPIGRLQQLAEDTEVLRGVIHDEYGWRVSAHILSPVAF